MVTSLFSLRQQDTDARLDDKRMVLARSFGSAEQSVGDVASGLNRAEDYQRASWRSARPVITPRFSRPFGDRRQPADGRAARSHGRVEELQPSPSPMRCRSVRRRSHHTHGADTAAPAQTKSRSRGRRRHPQPPAPCSTSAQLAAAYIRGSAEFRRAFQFVKDAKRSRRSRSPGGYHRR